MTQIKSYLSLESVPSQQFKTPPKNAIQTLRTNNSLNFSNTLGSADLKSLWNKKTLSDSNQFTRENYFQPQDFIKQQEDLIQNNSSITLNPVITDSDLFEFVNSIKMVAFLGKECEQRRILIQKKIDAINKLKSSILQAEERIMLHKSHYEKKQKSVKSRSLSMQKYKKQTSEKLENQIIGMKLEIKQMKRALSTQRVSNEGNRRDKRSGDRRRAYVETQRSVRTVYLPYSPYSSRPFYQQQTQTQRVPQINQIPPFQTLQMHHQPMHSNRNHPSEHSHRNSASNTQPLSMQPSNSNSNSKQRANSNVMHGAKILDLIQNKLQEPENLLINFNQSRGKAKSIINIQEHNPQFNQQGYNAPFPPPIHTIQKSAKSSHKKEKPLNLDYFDDPFNNEQDFKEELLMNSQRSRKSIKNLKQSSRSLTNKWKKDEEDHEIVELLKKSISGLPSERENNAIEKKEPMRSEIGAKIVVTTLREEVEDDESIIINLPENSRSLHKSQIHNNSQVDILIDNSEDKRNNESLQSNKRNSIKSNERQTIVNSEIGIFLNDLSDSHDDSPLKLQSKMSSPRKKNLSLFKEIPKIDEIEEDGLSRANTPIDFRDIHNLQPSFESRYTQTPRQTLKVTHQMANSNESYTSKQNSIPSNPLSRPPSLLQNDEEEQDIIDSIKLATNSKYFETPSGLSKQGNRIENHEEEQDFLGGIKLVAMSRISREKSSSQENVSALKQSYLQDSPEIQSKMTHSELAPSSYINNDSDGMDIIDSELRRSTNSVIVKKGSAIKRSINRKENTSLKYSNRGSTLSAKSGELQTPIQQVDEEQEEYSNIVRKHKRNITDAIN